MFTGCRWYGFLGGLTGTVSIATLTAISFDRYNVVVYPLNPKKSTTTLKSRLTILFVWIYGFIFAVMPLLDTGLSRYVPEGFLTACSFEYLESSQKAKTFMFIYFLFAYVLPLLIIIYCYFYILRIVVSADKLQSSKDKNKVEMKLALVVIGIIGLWFLAWTPYAVVALLGISNNHDYLTPLGSMIPAVFCKTSAVLNPFIYAVNHPRYKKELNRMLGCSAPSSATDYQNSYVSKSSGVGEKRDINLKSNTNNKRVNLQRGQSSMDSELSYSSDNEGKNSFKNKTIVSDSMM